MCGKKVINIWLAFRILKLEINCDNFCVAIVEILHLQFRYKFCRASCTH